MADSEGIARGTGRPPGGWISSCSPLSPCLGLGDDRAPQPDRAPAAWSPARTRPGGCCDRPSASCVSRLELAGVIRRWAEYVDATIVDVCSDDDVSGIVSPEERPGFTEGVRLIEAGKADTLVVAKFDRLARSMGGFVDVLKKSQDEGWRLICLDPEVDFGRAMGRGFAYMLITFAEIEREAFVDRMQGGRRAKGRAGGYVGGGRLHRRYGYQLEKDEHGRTVYVSHEPEQQVIRRMRELRDEGMTYRAIAAELGREGYEPPAGQAWYASAVQRILAR